MSKNALGICYESSTIFQIGEFVAKFWTVQIFWSQFTIGLRIARTDYGMYDSVIIKIFANCVRLSPRIQIFVDSWDSGPVWNRGIKQYFLHILSLETDKNPSWISGRWRMNVLVYMYMTNLQEIMDFGWVAMELTNPWWTAGLASDWATGPNKIILSYENYR